MEVDCHSLSLVKYACFIDFVPPNQGHLVLSNCTAFHRHRQRHSADMGGARESCACAGQEPGAVAYACRHLCCNTVRKSRLIFSEVGVIYVIEYYCPVQCADIPAKVQPA